MRIKVACVEAFHFNFDSLLMEEYKFNQYANNFLFFALCCGFLKKNSCNFFIRFGLRLFV